MIDQWNPLLICQNRVREEMDWDSEKRTAGYIVLGPSTYGHDVDRKELGHITTSRIREVYLAAYSAAIVSVNKRQLYTVTISAVAKKCR